MTALLQTLKSRVDNRPDSEHGQALTRVAMLVVVLAYLQFVVKGHAGVERGLALSLSFLALEFVVAIGILRSEEHTSELQPLMRISYAVFCLKKKNETRRIQTKLLEQYIITPYIPTTQN